jgi:hypothetical protein
MEGRRVFMAFRDKVFEIPVPSFGSRFRDNLRLEFDMLRGENLGINACSRLGKVEERAS